MSIAFDLDAVFKALANPVRRQICDALRDAPMTTGALCRELEPLDRCTVMMHLGVLQGAGLVIAVRKGRERWNHLDATPIAAIHQRWIGPHAAAAADRLLTLRGALESQPDRHDQVG